MVVGGGNSNIWKDRKLEDDRVQLWHGVRFVRFLFWLFVCQRNDKECFVGSAGVVSATNRISRRKKRRRQGETFLMSGFYLDILPVALAFFKIIPIFGDRPP